MVNIQQIRVNKLQIRVNKGFSVTDRNRFADIYFSKSKNEKAI
jgi:hypothetical protein